MYLWRVGQELLASGKGTTFPSINYADLAGKPVPLPPLAEQHRIVAKVDELMDLLDRLEAARRARETARAATRDAALAALRDADTPEEVKAAWKRIAGRMDDLFTTPGDLGPLREAVRQLAIRGRLVSQELETEHASKIVNIVAAEKARLVSQKVVRKSKPPSSIARHEILFELPEGWTWCSLGMATLSLTYGTSRKSLASGEMPVIRMGNLQDGEIDWSDLKFTSEGDDIETYALDKGSVLFNRTNSPALVGKTAIYRGERSAIYAGYLIRIKAGSGVEPEYLNILLNSPFGREWCWRTKVDGVSQSNISGSKLTSFPVPLPPTSEQIRIVNCVNQLLTLVRNLEATLEATDSAHIEFANAAVHHLDT